MINVIVTCPEPIFIKSIDSKEHKHTGKYLAKIIRDTMDKFGRQKFFFIVTDSASSNRNAWKRITDEMSHVYAHGCVCHILNLLIGDIKKLPVVKNVVEEAQTVVNTVLNHQYTRAKLNQSGNRSLKRTVTTRWLSLETSLRSLIQNKDDLKKLAIDDEVKKEYLESDESKMSEVFTVFQKIKQHLVTLPNTNVFSTYKDELLQIYQNRREIAIHQIHLVAHVLDPRNNRKLLSQKENDVVVAFFAEKGTVWTGHCSDTLMENLGHFNKRTGPFSSRHTWTYVDNGMNMAPSTWWDMYFYSQPLADIVIRVLTAPPSSASCERSFSVQKNIHTLLRNRLLNEKVDKMLYIKINTLILDQKKSAEPQQLSTTDSEEFSEEVEEVEEVAEIEDFEIPNDEEEEDYDDSTEEDDSQPSAENSEPALSFIKSNHELSQSNNDFFDDLIEYVPVEDTAEQDLKTD
ncbi:hypothetical protein DMENIID0001_057330 [Sergentomyia squamirostris]